MDDNPPEMRPIAAPLCPLCGQPNACRPAQTGVFSQPCWCLTASFSTELLARVPEDQRNAACICQACAAAAPSPA